MNTCMYTRGCGQSRIILGIHVDDQAIIRLNKHVIYLFKSTLSIEFKMKDLGSLTHILGVEVKRDRKNRVMKLHQGSYMRQVLERYRMQNYNPSKLPFTPGLTFNQDDEPTQSLLTEHLAMYSASAVL